MGREAWCFQWNKSIPRRAISWSSHEIPCVAHGKEKEQIQRFENGGGRRPFPFGGVQSTRKSGSPRLPHFRMSLVRHGAGVEAEAAAIEN